MFVVVVTPGSGPRGPHIFDKLGYRTATLDHGVCSSDFFTSTALTVEVEVDWLCNLMTSSH